MICYFIEEEDNERREVKTEMLSRGLVFFFLLAATPLGLMAAYRLIVLLQTPSPETLQNLSLRLDEINRNNAANGFANSWESTAGRK